jgi:hypothetical protein
VRSRFLSASVSAVSARSKEIRMRLRIFVASVRLFRPGAAFCHSSWPK